MFGVRGGFLYCLLVVYVVCCVWVMKFGVYCILVVAVLLTVDLCLWVVDVFGCSFVREGLFVFLLDFDLMFVSC